MAELRVLIAGGGTGGHLFPALAIGDELRGQGAEVKFIGSKYGIESTVLKNRGEDAVLLGIRGLQRSFTLIALGKNILFPLRFVISLLKSFWTIYKFSPQVVVGTGGYSAGLPLLAAVYMGKKTLIQEQNSFPGITTRNLSQRVDIICIAYAKAQDFIKKKARLLGNPVRKDIQLISKKKACKKLGLNHEQKVIFIVGGSQGSRPFNDHFSAVYPEYCKIGIQLLWQTGLNEFELINKSINDVNVKLMPFIDDMGTAYSAADIVVSRAGAMAIEELKSFGKAMVLIPFPQAAGNHQTANANALESENAAICFPQNKFQTGELESLLFDLLRDSNKRDSLAKNASKMAFPNALDDICTTITDLSQA
jgi:UDP-N-acetylglucosamine--N-acetylmuramyl-(pentapeptide) pyrophosphoryl-undecaprenol N-acetylglucosamine transferase